MIKLKDLIMEKKVLSTAGIILTSARGVVLVKETDWWGIPKGKVDPGEEPIQAACREVLEETSIFINVNGSHINDPVKLKTTEKNSRGGDFFIYESRLKLPVLPVKSFEHEEVRYFEEIPENLDPRLKGLI